LIQIAPGIGRIALGQGAEAIPEVARIALVLGSRRNGHLGTLVLCLRSSGRTLILRTGVYVARSFVGHRVRTVSAEELTGVVRQDVWISQDCLVSTVLISKFLKQTNCFNQLIVGRDQCILNSARIVIEDGRSVSSKMI
jgi:hypothetical protein